MTDYRGDLAALVLVLDGFLSQRLTQFAEQLERPAQLVNSLPVGKILAGLGFGPPYVDFGNGIGASCETCSALVVEYHSGANLGPFVTHERGHGYGAGVATVTTANTGLATTRTNIEATMASLESMITPHATDGRTDGPTTDPATDPATD